VKRALGEFIQSARWFGGKGRDFRVAEVTRAGVLQGPPKVGIELVTVEYTSTGGGSETGDRELYQVPLVYYPAPEDRLQHAFVGTWDDEELGTVHAYDAIHDRYANALWLQAFASAGRAPDGIHREGALTFHRLPGYDLDIDVWSTPFSGEQSNSTVFFGEDSLMKLFRKVTPGRNPDIEIHEALTSAESEHVAALYGWLEVPGSGDQPVHLGMLQQFLRTATDGWGLALASVRDLYAEADLHADEVGGDFAAEAHRLGIATGEVHAALARAFPTRTWGTEELKRLAAAMRNRLDTAVGIVPALAPYVEALRATYAAVEEITEPVTVQRVHGDYHLGQVLRTTLAWKIVDFEGEPAKPLAERVEPDSPWRDVAGMLRSFDYAAHAVEADVDADEEAREQIAFRASEWAQRNQSEYLAGYLEAIGHAGPGLGSAATLDRVARTLLDAYQADKAVYETVYEARNRPGWVGIPVAAIGRITADRAAEGKEEDA
jgi:maltokinase